MASVGPNSPASTVNTNGGGTKPWTNPNNSQASDNAYATHAAATGTYDVDFIDATQFGFSLPAGAIIDGIIVEIERKSSHNLGPVNYKDKTVQLLKAGSVVGTNKADTATMYPLADAYVSYGGATDLWGTTWTEAEIEASGFGVRFNPRQTNNS